MVIPLPSGQVGHPSLSSNTNSSLGGAQRNTQSSTIPANLPYQTVSTVDNRRPFNFQQSINRYEIKQLYLRDKGSCHSILSQTSSLVSEVIHTRKNQIPPWSAHIGLSGTPKTTSAWGPCSLAQSVRQGCRAGQTSCTVGELAPCIGSPAAWAAEDMTGGTPCPSVIAKILVLQESRRHIGFTVLSASPSSQRLHTHSSWLKVVCSVETMGSGLEAPTFSHLGRQILITLFHNVNSVL